MPAPRNSPAKRRTPKPMGERRSRSLKPNRPQTVWMALVAAMTVAGGVLYAINLKEPVGSGGMVLPPLMATTGPNSVEIVLNTRKPLASNWKSLVIHSTGSPVGNQASLDSQARSIGLRGIGYHFVIGNGNGMGDGELFVTDRWLNQTNGAHVSGKRGDELNRQSIGICLVGDGDRQRFTDAQLRRLVQLVDTLQSELSISPERVYLHSDVASVNSPGRLFPAVELRKMLASRK